MRKTSIPNKLATNRKLMLGVCDENEEEKNINDCRLKYFAVKRSTLEACRRTVTQRIPMIFATRILHSIKVLVL